MIKMLTTPLGGPSFRLFNDKPLNTTGKVYFRLQADLAVDSTSKSRSSLYDVLGIKRNATSTEIKDAYRNLAKMYHPDSSDIGKHDDGKFIEIHDAYSTLYDPADRAMYDMKLKMELGRRARSYTIVGKKQVVFTSRRWETDQCW